MVSLGRFCGFCGSELSDRERICPNCGRQQPGPAAPYAAPSAQPTISGRFCGFCGTEIPANAVDCPACGRVQAEVQPEPLLPEPSRAAPPTVAGPEASTYTTDEMVVVRDLSVVRGKKTLIGGIDFSVHRGEIVGILGPSGAGKTTLIRVLTAEYPCSPGQVAMGGLDIATQSRSAKQIFGYVPQETQLYEDLTFLQNVMYFGGQYGLDDTYLLQRAEELANVVELGDRLNDRVARLSGGQKKRVSVCTALAHNPELIILDEPTSGLDPGTRRGLWKFLKSVSQNFNLTMLVTTHFLDEAEYCDRLLIINKGRMVVYDSPRNLKERMPGRGKAIELEMFTLDEYVSAKLGQFESMAKKEEVAELVDRSGYKIKVFCADIPTSIVRIPILLAELGLQFKSLDIVDTSMEDAFLYFTGEHFKEAEY